MTSLKDFFNRHDNDISNGVSHKNNIIKRNVVADMALNGESTLADLSKKLNVSIPTITKLVNELIKEDIVTDNGKIETSGGRRPNIFGLANTAIYFAGVDIGRDSIYYVITDLQNNIILNKTEENFTLNDDLKTLEDICDRIDRFIKGCEIEVSKILGIGICIAGRVNPKTGRSYKYFTSTERPIREIIEERVGVRVLLENDTRAWTYAEYFSGNVKDEKNILCLHVGRGVAVGIIIDGKLYYGKSGFAGEFGHTPFFDNEIICGCGKKGCLETEVSGIALENRMATMIDSGVNSILKEKYEQEKSIHIDDIVAAAKSGDTLSIELIESAAEKIGKSVAFLINIFNPELVIIGGSLSHSGDYMMLPLKAATNKYSLGLVYKDTRFRLSTMTTHSGALGVAMLIRNNIIGV